MGLLGTVVAAGSALAQPANDPCTGAIELTGTFPQLTTPVDISQCVAPAEAPICASSTYTLWYKVVAQNNGTLTATTCAADTPGTTWSDTVTALYSSGDGTCDTLTQLVCVDDNCGLRQTVSAPVTAGQTYYIQVGKFSTATPGAGAFVQLKVTAPNLVEPPTGVGSASPATFDNCSNTEVYLEVATTPGNLPASTVTIDLSSIGGSSNQVMSDPDGDSIFAFAYQVPNGIGSGARTLPFVVADSNNLGSPGNIALTINPCPPQNPWEEQDDAGDVPSIAQMPIGEGSLSGIVGWIDGSDADMYAIDICDVGTFSATARVFTAFDTQLFLFNSDGIGVAANDDSGGTLQSTVTNRWVTMPGLHYLAITRYNRDPVDEAGQLIFPSTPFADEHTNTGPGGANPVFGWLGTTSGVSQYTISLGGACYPGGGGGCPACAADFNEDGGVDGGDVEAFYVAWGGGGECGDVNQDGGVDGGDVEAFFIVWEQGGC